MLQNIRLQIRGSFCDRGLAFTCARVGEGRAARPFRKQTSRIKPRGNEVLNNGRNPRRRGRVEQASFPENSLPMQVILFVDGGAFIVLSNFVGECCFPSAYGGTHESRSCRAHRGRRPGWAGRPSIWREEQPGRRTANCGTARGLAQEPPAGDLWPIPFPSFRYTDPAGMTRGSYQAGRRSRRRRAHHGETHAATASSKTRGWRFNCANWASIS